jgi:hypothetical protein
MPAEGKRGDIGEPQRNVQQQLEHQGHLRER